MIDDFKHVHQYLPLQNNSIKSYFEPVSPEIHGEDGLYRLVEYVIMFCKCGESLLSQPYKQRLDDKEK